MSLCTKGNFAFEERVLYTFPDAESEISDESRLFFVRCFQHKTLGVDSDFSVRGCMDFHRLVTAAMMLFVTICTKDDMMNDAVLALLHFRGNVLIAARHL